MHVDNSFGPLNPYDSATTPLKDETVLNGSNADGLVITKKGKSNCRRFWWCFVPLALILIVIIVVLVINTSETSEATKVSVSSDEVEPVDDSPYHKDSPWDPLVDKDDYEVEFLDFIWTNYEYTNIFDELP